MNGFLNYILFPLQPMSNIGLFRAMGELMRSALAYWWLVVVIFVLTTGTLFVVWIVYFVKPALVRPPLPPLTPLGTGVSDPLVSLVIAGRNESATIGESIRGALLSGYPKLEVIFVDDNSDDDSVAIARRAALSVTRSRWDSERVRIFPSPRRNGKASSLNIGIRMARGKFIAITDADTVMGYGCVRHWLRPFFADPRVGAVCGNIRVLNSNVNLITRLQEFEYALKFGIRRYIDALFNLLNIAPGMGSMFRADIVRALGGYDTGLGDDTDMTMNIRKQRWKIDFDLDAVVWTTVPITRAHLWSQRMRWRRNLIKTRVSKHRDQFVLGRYGLANAVLSVLTIWRMLVPTMIVVGLVNETVINGPFHYPHILVAFYWMAVFLTLIRVLLVRAVAETPQPQNCWLLFLYPFYYLSLLPPVLYAQIAEFLRIGAKNPNYVPDHIWEEIPWW